MSCCLRPSLFSSLSRSWGIVCDPFPSFPCISSSPPLSYLSSKLPMKERLWRSLRVSSILNLPHSPRTLPFLPQPHISAYDMPPTFQKLKPVNQTPQFRLQPHLPQPLPSLSGCFLPWGQACVLDPCSSCSLSGALHYITWLLCPEHPTLPRYWLLPCALKHVQASR